MLLDFGFNFLGVILVYTIHDYELLALISGSSYDRSIWIYGLIPSTYNFIPYWVCLSLVWVWLIPYWVCLTWDGNHVAQYLRWHHWRAVHNMQETGCWDWQTDIWKSFQIKSITNCKINFFIWVSYSPTSRKQPPKMKTIVMTLLACKVSQFVGSVKSHNPRREVKSLGGVIVYQTFIPQLPCAAITACWYTSIKYVNRI